MNSKLEYHSAFSKESDKDFAAGKSNRYEQTIDNIQNWLLVNVQYTIRPGKREEFLEKVIAHGIISASRAEPGNYKYEYYKPIDAENVLFLMEMWVSSEAQTAHGKTEHYQHLQSLKKEFVTNVLIEKFSVSSISSSAT